MIFHLCLLWPLAALLHAASIPQRSDDEVRLYNGNGNGNNGWEGAIGRAGGRGGGGGGAMMWSGWGPGGMTAFTSTGGELQPPSAPADEGVQGGDESKAGDSKAPQSPSNSDGESSRANAQASFNAWFPIVLGMFPGGQQGQGKNGGGWPPVAAIANSISHGARGVATSHAVAYGGGPPPQSYHQQQPAQLRQQPRH